MAGKGNTTQKNTATRKKASSKTTSGRSTSSRKKTTASPKVQRDDKELALIKGLIIIASFALCIFLFLCCTDLFSTKTTDFIKSILIGLFGINAYVLPFAIPGIYIFTQKGKDTSLYLLKLISLVTLVFITGLGAHIIAYNDLADYKKLSYLSAFFDGQKGGGVIFGCPALWLEMLISKPGAVLLLILLTLISFYILLGNFVFRVIREGTERYKDEKDDEVHYVSPENKGNIGFSIFKKLGEDSDENDIKEQACKPKAKVKQSGVTFDTDLKKTGNSNDLYNTHVINPPSGQDITVPDNVDIPVKESNDIHQVIYNTQEIPETIKVEEDDWVIKPTVSNKNVSGINNNDSLVTVENRVKDITEIDLPVKEDIKPASFMDDKEEVKTVKPVAHLRSRDKADLPSVTLTGDLAESLKPKKDYNEYKFPPLSLLTDLSSGKKDSAESLKETAAKLEQVFETFGVNVKVTDYSQGPAVTRYELLPDKGVKVNKIISLADDIKLNLAAADIRIEAPIPGKSAIGIEVPNQSSSAVAFKDIVASDDFKNNKAPLAFALGKDIAGKNVIADIAQMPHLLIAGATGSGKSVCINTLIMSILYKSHPDDVKLIMVDPKVVELSVYNNIPHLLLPVVTDPKLAANALKWSIKEMTDRYEKFSDVDVRSITAYNEMAASGKCLDDGTPMQKMYHILIIVDELADLMMVAGKEVEESIIRLTQLSRAAGIHLVLATQRPSVDVITGLIKANMPSRIAFAVSSGIDSRTILDSTGAEKLLGKGDMLFLPRGVAKPSRVQGCFVSDNDVTKVVSFIKDQNYKSSKGQSTENINIEDSTGSNDILAASSSASDGYDELFEQCGRIIIEKEKASIGYLQRFFKIGFNRAARIMDQLEEAGVVGPEEGTKPRRIIMTSEQFDEYLQGKH